MRILYDEYGRTGNRLFAYLDSVGYALVKKKKLIILFPDDILKHYDSFRNNEHIWLPLWGKSPFVLRIARRLLYNNNPIQMFYRTRLSKKLGWYAGWDDLRESHVYYPQVRSEIEKLFTPNDNVTQPINAVFSRIRHGGGKIVGIHIRKEDYKTAYGGIYYYDDSVYVEYMKQILAIQPNVVFYISSNEKISDSFFERFKIIEKPLDSAVADLYALSQCDYIIGPPSTFNCWASFIGNVPLYTMFKKDDIITSMKDFKIIRDDKR